MAKTRVNQISERILECLEKDQSSKSSEENSVKDLLHISEKMLPWIQIKFDPPALSSLPFALANPLPQPEDPTETFATQMKSRDE
jgi:hypothetical protein